MDQINSLPDHILVQIFENLSPNMVKCCALVCKRWDEVIGNSIELMGRYRLNLERSEEKNIQNVNDLKRKYQSAKIERLRWFSGSSLDVINMQNLRHLKISYYKELKLSILVNILRKFTQLKILKINLQSPIDDISKEHTLQTNLEQLNCDIDIVHMFDCKTIKKLKMCWNKNNKIFEMMAINFLKQQLNVEDMTLHGNYMTDFFSFPEIFELKFNLKRLIIDNRCMDKSFLHCDTLIRFLSHHKNSLNSLELYISMEPELGIIQLHNFVLKSLINLKHIKFGYMLMPDENNSILPFDALTLATQVVKNIESIDIILKDNEDENQQCLAMFPNLKHLTSRCWFYLDKASLLPINANLETLKICDEDGDGVLIDLTGTFSNLKELSFGHYNFYNSDMDDFITRHFNTLEKIKIRGCDFLSIKTLKAVNKCHRLKCLELIFMETFKISAILCLINMIETKTRSFTLMITYDCLKPKYKFIFPDDQHIWDDMMENSELKVDKKFCKIQ